MEIIAAGGKLQRCRTEFLPEIPPPRKVLLAGEGHGRFLPECVRYFPEAEVTVIDFSGKMIELSKRSCRSGKVKFVHADVLEWPGPAAEFDLVVTNFFLDCFTPQELDAVVKKLARMAAPDAEWLLADFQVSATRPAAAVRSRVILAMLYGFFKVVCQLSASRLTEPNPFITAAGFHLHRRKESEWGLLKSEWWRRASTTRCCESHDAGL